MIFLVFGTEIESKNRVSFREEYMGKPTRGQQTARQVLELLEQYGQRRLYENQSHRKDLETFRCIVERASSDSAHPLNAILTQVRGWGFEDGEKLIREIRKDS